MKMSDRMTLITVVGVLAIAALTFDAWHVEEVALSPATTKTADSLAATKPAFDSQMVASAAAGAASHAEQLRHERHEQLLRALSDSVKHQADSLAAVAATSADSVQAWRKAYESRTTEATTLRGELAEKEQRITELVGDTVRLSNDKAAGLDRLTAVEDLNVRIRRDVAAQGCAVLTWPKRVRCPTRKETAIGTAVITLLAARR